MKRKDGILALCIAMVLCLCLIPSAMALTEEQNTTLVKDGAQLKIEALEAELGEEGMQKFEEYMALQASLPDVVKNMPFKGLAFTGTQEESRSVTFKYIGNFDVSEEEKDYYKAGIQDVWGRYPFNITKDDYEFMSEIGPMLVAESSKVPEPISEVPELISVNWASSPHKSYAYYACNGSIYRSYAHDASDDPDNGIMDPEPFYRYYNHYEDGYLHVGGAPGRCNEFAKVAILAMYNGDEETAHQRFGYSSHYIADPGIPFHSDGLVYQGVDTLWNGYENSNHYDYEAYVSSQWTTGYDYQYYVETNTQSNTVTDPETAVEDLAEYSSDYFDYIWAEMYNDPENWEVDAGLVYRTAMCVQETARYTRGLYDYIELMSASHPYDENQNCLIDIGELNDAIDDYSNGLITIGEVNDMIDLYASTGSCC